MNRIARMILWNWWRVPTAFAKLWHYSINTDRYPEDRKYAHIQYMMKRAVLAGNVNLEVFGVDNLPEKNGFVLFANHQGLFDVVAILATCPRPISAVLKKEMYKYPLVHEMARCTHSLLMDRGSIKQSVEIMKQVGEEVKEGRNFLIFPEGTRSRKHNEIGEFMSGSFRCAMIAECPIVPVLFHNSWKVLDQPGSSPVSVQIHYLEPIPYSEYGHLTSHRISALVRSRLEEAQERIQDKDKSDNRRVSGRGGHILLGGFDMEPREPEPGRGI